MSQKSHSLDSVDDETLHHISLWLQGSDLLCLYCCGQKSLNYRLTKRIVTDLVIYAKRSDGKLPAVVREFECLSSLDISFGPHYSDLYKLEQLDLSLIPTSLTRLSLCCANASDVFETFESAIQVRENILEHHKPGKMPTSRPPLPDLKQLILSTRASSHSLAKRVPHKFLPDANLVSTYMTFPMIGQHLTKLKTVHWEQAFIGLLPDSLEDLELEVGLIIKSFTAFNIMPQSLTSLKGLIVMDHSIGWEVEFDTIYESIQHRAPQPRFAEKLQLLEASTGVFYKAIWDVIFDWMSAPTHPHPVLERLIDYPPNLQTLHMKFEEYGALLLFHLPPSLTDLRAHNSNSALSTHHLRYLPKTLKSFCLEGEPGEVTAIETLIGDWPPGLTRLRLNAAFSVSSTILSSLPQSLIELDVYGSKSLSVDVVASLPSALATLNLHRNLHPKPDSKPVQLPPNLTKVNLPSVWNAVGWLPGIPNGLTSLTTPASTAPPLAVQRWGSRLTSLSITHTSHHATSSAAPPPGHFILNILPPSLTFLSCPYSFLGIQNNNIDALAWPPHLLELALFQAQRAPLEFFQTLPHSLRCLYIGDTQYHGEYIPHLPRRLVWLQLKTPIRAEYIADLPPQILALIVSILSPTSSALETFPKTLRYLHAPNLPNNLPALKKSPFSRTVVRFDLENIE